MKFSILHSILLLIIFISPLVVLPQENDVDVKLSLAEDKKVFKMDEPILLNLTYTANRGEYNLATLKNDAAAYEEIILSPESGVFDWKSEYKRGRRYLNDHFAYTKLPAKPFTISLYLNDFLRFDKPGKYEVKIKTKRVPIPISEANKRSFVSEIITNAISFEIVPMSKVEEQQKVQKISEQLKTKLSRNQLNELANELAFMGGDTATKAKVWHFLNPSENFSNAYHNLHKGLFISRNRQLVIKLLEEDLRNVEREANFGVLGVLVDLRVMSDENLALSSDGNSKAILEYRESRAEEITGEYLNELLLSLPLRKGRNRATTAVTILDNIRNRKDKDKYIESIKNTIVSEFENLYINHQNRMLDYYWDLIKTPALIPVLERILSNSDNNMFVTTTQKTALKRLIELDEDKARPFVVEELKNPKSVIEIETVGHLKDDFLPETDQALLEQIRQMGKMEARDDFVRLRLKTQLAARFASDAIYDELLNIYRSSQTKWQANSKGALIGYFARHNEDEAVRLMEDSMENMESGHLSTFLNEATEINYPKAVNDFLLKLLEGDETEKSNAAVWLISKNGGVENKEIILSRYKRWLDKWKERREEFNVEKPSVEISKQIMFQINVVTSLLNAKLWKLSDKEKAELAKTCLTESCLRYFPEK